MIEIKKLTKIYKINKAEVKVLDNINLSFPASGLVAILGASGAGKTTLLNIIAGLDKKVKGKVIINKKNILRFGQKRLCKYRCKSIGYVFQEAHLFNFLKVAENVKIPARIGGFPSQPLKLLKQVKMDKYVNKLVGHLSGGQKQRVAIARALVNDPPLILCDEPTGALDRQNTINVMEILKELAKDKLVIMVTHNNEIAQKYCDRIIRLKDGHVEVDEIINPVSALPKKRKFVPRMPFSSLWFVLSYALLHLKTKTNRTLITAFSASAGLLGIILSMALGQGFQSYFAYEFAQYQQYDGIYMTKTINDDYFSVELDDLQQLANSTNTQYGYFVNLSSSAIHNIASINNFEAGFDTSYLGYTFIEDGSDLGYDEIGLKVNPYYLEYMAYITSSSNTIEAVQEKLNTNAYYLKFEYQDDFANFKKNFKIKKIIADSSVSLFHDKPDFVYQAFCDLPLSWSPYSDEEGLNITSYLRSPSNEQKVLLSKCKDYEYLHDQNITKYYKVSYVYYTTFYRFDFAEVKDIYYQNELDSYVFSFFGGINLNLSFMYANIAHLRGDEVIFRPLLNQTITGKAPHGFEEVVVSSALAEQVGKTIEYYNSYFDVTATLKVVGTIPSNELVIFQNSEWSMLFFYDFLGIEEHRINGQGAVFFASDLEETMTSLYELYPEYEFFCPLIEIMKTVNSLLDIVVLAISALSVFSIVISSFLIGVITFVNIVEETRHIGLLRILGLKKSGVALIFVFESLLTGLLAFIITLVFSLLITEQVNLVFASLIGTPKKLISIRLEDIKTTFILLLSISFLAGLLPSLYASSMLPLKAVKQAR